MNLYRHYITKTFFYLGIGAVVGGVLAGCAAANPAGEAMLTPSGESGIFSTGGCLGDAPYSEPTIEQRGHLKFPPSVHHLRANSAASWEDCIIFVSFEMAVDDLQPLLDSTAVSSLEEKKGSDLSSFKDLLQSDADWTFDDKRPYRYGEGHNGLTTQYIVIDQSDSEFCRVYLITWLM